MFTSAPDDAYMMQEPDVVAPDLDSRAEEDEWLWASFRYHSRTFSMAARLLPSRVQLPVAALYLFCRHVDSIADHRVLEVGPKAALDEVHTTWDALDATLAGHPPAALLWRRLHEVHDRFGLHRTPLYELLEGAMWDLEDRPIRTLDDLVDYSNLVGGSVGAMMLPFLADADAYSQLEGAAREMGIAMQITNIVRDVGEDLRHLDRVYLPLNWFEAYDIAPQDLTTRNTLPEAYSRLLEDAMAAAESRYVSSMAAIGTLPWSVRTGIRAAARMYREIMNEVRALGYNNIQNRAYVSTSRKLWCVCADTYDRRKAHLQQHRSA